MLPPQRNHSRTVIASQCAHWRGNPFPAIRSRHNCQSPAKAHQSSRPFRRGRRPRRPVPGCLPEPGAMWASRPTGMNRRRGRRPRRPLQNAPNGLPFPGEYAPFPALSLRTVAHDSVAIRSSLNRLKRKAVPRGGHDNSSRRWWSPQNSFNPRAPWGGTTAFAMIFPSSETDFNPHAPWGGTTMVGNALFRLP